ncbi:hypothetical protein BYT27DRAFT_7337196 [Phlegmacium glaucopus]|nr:hypothetical protein BYT27DRAFT_7337196 [Phlegmacium glaucopus]
MSFAFVTFSVAGLKTLMPRARSRITAAGSFHNLVLRVFLALVTRLGLFSLASFVSGHRHISDIGSVDAAQSSDDTELGIKNASTDMWTKYLTRDPRHFPLDEKSVSCYSSSSTEESPFTYFISVEHYDCRCVDPLPYKRPSYGLHMRNTRQTVSVNAFKSFPIRHELHADAD